MTMTIRRGTSRFQTRGPGRSTRHALSFGEHYDPERLRLGPMLCHDDHLLGAGRGFETHAHQDLEILTWVLEGTLEHTDSLGTRRTLGRGEAALLSAGSGVEHAEVAGASACRFVQTWLEPDETSRPPSYAAATPDPASLEGRLATVASGDDPTAPLHLGTAGATLQVVRLDTGASLVLEPADGPPDTLRHVFVATGALTRFGIAEPLGSGDALEIPDAERVRPATLTAAVPTELMVWTFAGHASGRPAR